MTEKTQPTDAEIEALGHRMCWRYKHDTGVNHISTFTFNAQTLLDFSRAVLARWGQPAHSGEPVAWAFKYDDGTWHDPSTTEHSSGMRPLFEAPQPVEREPLTDEQAISLCKMGPVHAPDGQVVRTPEQYRRELEDAKFAGIRKAERAHGIT